MQKPSDPRLTEMTRLRRMHERGAHDPASIYAILDASAMCSVGYVIDGRPVVTPTFQWREGNHVYWHGSSASRMLRKSVGSDVCLTVSIMDGLVLGRSAMHHSANYRSVMVFGKAVKVEDPEEKVARLRAFVNGMYPGRWDMLRPITPQEIKATTILGMPIDEASAKVRDAGVSDDEADYELPIWAGVIPAVTTFGDAIADPRNLANVDMPDHVHDLIGAKL